MKWRGLWPQALSIWSSYTKLGQPEWAFSVPQEKSMGLRSSFAAIRLQDLRILISLRQIALYDLEDYGLEILAHEIGHHVLCPANLQEAGQAMVLVTLALPTFESQAAMVVNLWEDLLINDRLVRLHGQRHFEIYERLNARAEAQPGKIWCFYMRIYEILWGLQPGRLNPGHLEKHEEGDAHLGARMVRVYSEDWLGGVGGFASLCFSYFAGDRESLKKDYRILFDTSGLGKGCDVPLGILDVLNNPILHPSEDPRIMGDSHDATHSEELESRDTGEESILESGSRSNATQSREPFLFRQILKALGLKLEGHEIAAKLYRERALPHLIPFPCQEQEESQEPLLEGHELWEVGHPIEEIDWLASMLRCPTVIPGVSTVRRSWGVMGGQERDKAPLDLDLYVDCSGSIPNPQRSFSYLALAGAIVVLSALRTGAKVQITLWSGAGQFDTTPGFISDEQRLFRVLTGYLGGATAFPNHILRDTYTERSVRERPVHILVLSDEGVDTMENPDERNTPGLEIAQMAMKKARGGGTMVLNLYNESFLSSPFAESVKAMDWKLFMVKDWSGLLEFAREFAKIKYGSGRKASQPCP